MRAAGAAKARKTTGRRAPETATAKARLAERVEAALAALKQKATRATRDGMARYAIPSDNAYGVAMKDIKALGATLGRDQALAAALWTTGVYEARMLASFVGEPERLTPAVMDRWCRDFDNWGIVDTVCFVLFDRTPHAWKKVEAWSKKRDEFQRRAGLVLLACLALHDRKAADEAFLRLLPAAERAASDGRNFVRKGNSWALRSIGRRSAALNAATVELAQRLVDFGDPASRSLGREVLREITSPKVRGALARRRTDA